MYGRPATTETKKYDDEGRVIHVEEVVILGVGEATLLQEAIEHAASISPVRMGEALKWLAHAIGAEDSMNLEIKITRTWG